MIACLVTLSNWLNLRVRLVLCPRGGLSFGIVIVLGFDRIPDCSVALSIVRWMFCRGYIYRLQYEDVVAPYCVNFLEDIIEFRSMTRQQINTVHQFLAPSQAYDRQLEHIVSESVIV